MRGSKCEFRQLVGRHAVATLGEGMSARPAPRRRRRCAADATVRNRASAMQQASPGAGTSTRRANRPISMPRGRGCPGSGTFRERARARRTGAGPDRLLAHREGRRPRAARQASGGGARAATRGAGARRRRTVGERRFCSRRPRRRRSRRSTNQCGRRPPARQGVCRGTTSVHRCTSTSGHRRTAPSSTVRTTAALAACRRATRSPSVRAAAAVALAAGRLGAVARCAWCSRARRSRARARRSVLLPLLDRARPDPAVAARRHGRARRRRGDRWRRVEPAPRLRRHGERALPAAGW